MIAGDFEMDVKELELLDDGRWINDHIVDFALQ
jgi:Ulp1 family protease